MNMDTNKQALKKAKACAKAIHTALRGLEIEPKSEATLLLELASLRCFVQALSGNIEKVFEQKQDNK